MYVYNTHIQGMYTIQTYMHGCMHTYSTQTHVTQTQGVPAERGPCHTGERRPSHGVQVGTALHVAESAMCIYVCTYVYVCMHVYHTYVHSYLVLLFTLIDLCYVYVCIYTYTHTYIHTYTHISTPCALDVKKSYRGHAKVDMQAHRNLTVAMPNLTCRPTFLHLFPWSAVTHLPYPRLSRSSPAFALFV